MPTVPRSSNLSHSSNLSRSTAVAAPFTEVQLLRLDVVMLQGLAAVREREVLAATGDERSTLLAELHTIEALLRVKKTRLREALKLVQ